MCSKKNSKGTWTQMSNTTVRPSSPFVARRLLYCTLLLWYLPTYLGRCLPTLHEGRGGREKKPSFTSTSITELGLARLEALESGEGAALLPCPPSLFTVSVSHLVF
ncbi:hypothetical protein LZ32DRAFT_46873 [Colletotrichum eremochloae]|nr:hypothetical protein LZ32DRAFT_46873 [Colletotrichum eremochloae]